MTTTTLIPASPAQDRLLRSLLAERDHGFTQDQVDLLVQALDASALGKREASGLISHCLGVRPLAVAPSAVETSSGTERANVPANAGRVIVNKFAKPCKVCGGYVETGTGFACQVNGGWVTVHKGGECREVAPAPVATSSLNEILADVVDGYYAIPSKTGNNDLDFVRVSTNQGRTNPANKGKRYVSRVLGGHGTVAISPAEQQVFAKILAETGSEGLREAAARYGREIGSCGRCGRTLTDETSRALGLGPDCAGKVW